MYQFSDEINYENYFKWDKKLIEDMNWAILPSSSKAIYPVIGVHCDSRGLSFPGERRIAIMAGKTDKIVREGIKGLIGFPGFKMKYYSTRTRGKRSKKFFIEIPPDKRGRAYPFHRSIIDGGNWRELKPTAMALYPVMRYLGTFNFEQYIWEEEIEEDNSYDQFDEIYKDREYDFCESSIVELSELAGIDRRSINSAFNSLEECSLIESFEPGIWKVFLKPRQHFKRKFLNKKIMTAYRHEAALT